MPQTHGVTVAPRIGVIIPIFRHSVLLSEAIESVLDQSAGFPIRIVLINDGCPYRETDQVCRDYALAYPDQIFYLRKPNGGLSAARNDGIRKALKLWPSLEAIYMLDADNRLRPDALGNAMAALDADPSVDWIYPNIDMFGLQWAGDYGGEYSLLIHTAMNICEAGSLIRRSVFDAGVFFDATFKSGFEDWDFFLSAAEAGFRGKNIDNFGFLYRKRAESMLAESEREADAIRSVMRKKHHRLFSPRGQLELEQTEAPRYAIHLTDRSEVLLTTDPAAENPRRMSGADYAEMWFRAQTDTTQHHVPPLLVMTRSDVFDLLRQTKLLHGLLWTMERRLAQHPFVALELAPHEGERISLQEDGIQGNREIAAAVFMVAQRRMGQIVRDPMATGIAGLTARPCEQPAQVITLKLAESFFPRQAPFHQMAAHDFVALCSRLQGMPQRAALDHVWDWRRPDIPWRLRTHEIPRMATGAEAAFPRLARSGRDIGFVLPLVEFGGVERVALNTAQALKRAGWQPHLFVLDAQDCQFTHEWQESFDSVTFLSDPKFATWGGGAAHYFGTVVSDWSRNGDQANAAAMLAWLDVVINFHGGGISGVMGRLRRFGVKTATSLHLNDHTPFGRLVGNTYLGLAFEHAYDLFLPCSEQLADWCHAMGVPAEKIIPLLNAPSFELPPKAESSIDARRSGNEKARNLRVMYLGRLDPQKGLDRLISILDVTRSDGLPIDWRLIGKAVFADGAALPSRITEMIEPPLTTAEDLAEAMQWADVFILPSYFEGLPLTILEAMRSGVVPIATDAGAVTEVVHHWQNGVVLSQGGAVNEAVLALSRLCRDRDLLRQLSQKARIDMLGRNWDATVRPVIDRLAGLLA